MILSLLLGCLAQASENLSLDLEDAEAASVFRLLGEITGQDVLVPECAAHQRLTLRLENTPPELVWGVLERELDVSIVDVGGLRVVQCLSPVELPPELASQRVSVSASSLPTSVVLEQLAESAGLELRAEVPDFATTLAFSNVRLETALPLVAEALHLGELRVEHGALIASAQRSLAGERLSGELLNEAMDRLPACGAEVGLLLDAEGRVVWARELDGACPIEVVEGGEPVVWVETRLPGPGLQPGAQLRALGYLEDSPIDALVGDLLLEPAGLACDETRCEVVLTTASNEDLAEAMSRMESDYAEVYLVEIQRGPRGGKQGRITFER
jgi:hypothetical protein